LFERSQLYLEGCHFPELYCIQTPPPDYAAQDDLYQNAANMRLTSFSSSDYITDRIGRAERYLHGTFTDDKPKFCPGCPATILSIRSYGRLLRLVELRGLERKHLMLIDSDNLADPGTKGSIFRLETLVKAAERSPMRAVYGAMRSRFLHLHLVVTHDQTTPYFLVWVLKIHL
jgi:hypothetical protein